MAVAILMFSPEGDARAQEIAPDSIRLAYCGVQIIQARGAPYGSEHYERVLDHLRSLGVNWVSLSPMGFLATLDRPGPIREEADPQRNARTLRRGIQVAHRYGMKVMLKPDLWHPSFAQGKWRGDVAMRTEAEWEEWFREYELFLRPTVEVAEAAGAELLCIGIELVAATRARPENWRRLIRAIRARYHGQLTYAAHMEEYELIAFWNDLDVIGVDAYFSMSSEVNPSVEQLIAALRIPVRRLAELSKRTGMPIVFTEMGYRSIQRAWYKPWQWEWGAGGRQDSVDLEAQAKCYQAVMAAFLGQPWFRGLFVWKYYAHPDKGGPEDTSFTPHNKPAEAVLAAWFGRRNAPILK